VPVLALHDGSPNDDQDRSRTARATALIIRTMQARGYRFVTVKELLQVHGDSHDRS